MAMAFIQEDENILNFLSTYGKVKQEQLESLFNPKRVNKLITKGILEKQNSFVLLKNTYEPRVNNLYIAIDLLIHFKDRITYHTPANYPFVMFFILDNKPYDVAIIEPGQEAILEQLINRSDAENVVAIVSDIKQAEKLNIKKNVTYCTLNPIKLYK